MLLPCWKALSSSPCPQKIIKTSSFLGSYVSSILCCSSYDEFHLACKHTTLSSTSGLLQMLFLYPEYFSLLLYFSKY